MAPSTDCGSLWPQKYTYLVGFGVFFRVSLMALSSERSILPHFAPGNSWTVMNDTIFPPIMVSLLWIWSEFIDVSLRSLAIVFDVVCSIWALLLLRTHVYAPPAALKGSKEIPSAKLNTSKTDESAAGICIVELAAALNPLTALSSAHGSLESIPMSFLCMFFYYFYHWISGVSAYEITSQRRMVLAWCLYTYTSGANVLSSVPLVFLALFVKGYSKQRCWDLLMDCLVYAMVLISTSLIVLPRISIGSLRQSLNHVYWRSWNGFSNDYTPNMGLYWYFFQEVFPEVRTFYVVVFHFMPYIYLVPLCLRLGRSSAVLWFWIAFSLTVFNSLQTYYHLGIVMVLLLPYRIWFTEVRNGPVLGLFLLFSIVLTPFFYHSWMGMGTGNVNYFYMLTLLYNGAITVWIGELLNAHLTVVEGPGVVYTKRKRD